MPSGDRDHMMAVSCENELDQALGVGGELGVAHDAAGVGVNHCVRWVATWVSTPTTNR